MLRSSWRIHRSFRQSRYLQALASGLLLATVAMSAPPPSPSRPDAPASTARAFALPPVDAVVPPASPAVAYAQRVSALVRRQDVAALVHLAAPRTSSARLARLQGWKKRYVRVMLKMAAQRRRVFTQQSTQSQKLLHAGKIVPAFEHMRAAYAFALHHPAFKRLAWVRQLSTQVAHQAAVYVRRQRWLEALELYSQLNAMYRISRRYHRPMQRLLHRSVLLAEYTPRQFYHMRMQAEKLMLEPAVPPATRPAVKKPAPTTRVAPIVFPRWQHAVQGIKQDMLLQTLELAEHRWVFPLTYNRLVVGGIHMLELFPTTPLLARTFSGLRNRAADARFSALLKRQLARAEAKTPLDSTAMIHLWRAIRRANHSTVRLPRPVLVKEFTDGALDQLDPFTEVFWPSDVPNFEKMMEGTFGGVGIEIRQDNGLLRVISPLNRTPAYYAGIQAGDLIVTVNGRSIMGMSLDAAIRAIMGPPGTYVNLGIRRGNNPQLLSFRLRRAQIRVASVDGFKRNPVTGQWRFMIAPTSRIGYIRVTQFQQNTAAELAAAWRHLARHRVRGLIIDLRYNPGGLLETALRMCNMFLPAGTILSTKGRTQPRHVWTADGNPLVPPSIPLVVLVNQDSASAAEIFSGSMKDLHRALIVGHQTFGKGSVQNLIPLGANAQALIKLTMAHYYLPDGECIQRLPHAATWGVEPNVRVPFSPWQMGLLQRTWEQKDILPPHRSASSASSPPPSTRPATTRPTGRGRLAERSFDTQLDTALLLLRLQLAQARD